MQQPNLLCEKTRKMAVSEEVAKETPNQTNCPFLAARLVFENEVVANTGLFSGSMTNAMRTLRVPALKPEFAWAIAFTKYWEEYKPTQSAFTFEAAEVFQARLKSAIEVSPFFKWRFENEQLAKEKQITFTTWFLRQPVGFIRQTLHLLVVLEVLRSATIQQLEELAMEYPNLFLADTFALCPAFATFALTHQTFDVINERGALDTAFRSVDFATQQQFFNDNLRERPASILSPFFTNHKAFAIDYFLSQLPGNLTPALLQNYLNTKLLAFLEDDLKLISTSRSFEITKRKLALSRIAKHTQHLRTAFVDCTAEALAANIRIFSVIVTADLLLSLIRRDVDNLTECLMQNYALYDQFIFGADAIVSKLDFSQPHLAARFVQHIPVKTGLVLNDAQLAALAKRTDVTTLSWLIQYFPTNPQVLTRLILQERPLLEYVLANPNDEIVSSLINDFPYTEVRPVTLLTAAMDKLRKCYPLTKEQLSKMLSLCDDTISDWLFKNENDFPAMQEIRSDASLCNSLRATNPRFLAHTIFEQNTSYENFFDLVLTNPAFVIRMNQNTPVALQCYLLVAKKHLEQHINADPIHTTLRTASIAASAMADPRNTASAKIDVGAEVKSKISALRKQKKDFDTLVAEISRAQGTDKLARLYVLYTHESVADKDLNGKPAKITLAELLINACFDSPAKQYELLIMVLSEREAVKKTTWKMIGDNIVTPIDYLPIVKQCFLARLEKLEITQLLDLLSHHLLCNTVFKFYPEEMKTLLYRRAEQDNSFTLLALCAPEHRALFDRRVNTLTETKSLLTQQEQHILLTNICNRTSDACSILATNLTLLSWCFNKHPDRIKNIIAVGLEAGAITLDVVLRSPELTQIFSSDELLHCMTTAQAKASLHYRHVFELFNDEPKLRKLLTKAQLTAQDLLQQLFKLETGNYSYLYARALLRVINGESDVNFPKPPAPTTTAISGTATFQREPSLSAFKPYALVSTPEKASAKHSAADAADINISSPLSLSTISRGSGSDIAKPAAALFRADSLNDARIDATDIVVSAPLHSAALPPRSGSDISQQPPAPLVRTESLHKAPAASPKSPSGSVITEAATSTPVRTSVASSFDSPPPAPSGNTTPMTSVVLPTSPTREAKINDATSQPVAITAASSTLAVAQPLASTSTNAASAPTHEAGEKPTPPSASASSPRKDVLAQSSTAPNAAAADATSSSLAPTDTENKETSVSAPPAPTPTAIKPPPPLKKPAATSPLSEGAPAPQPGRSNLLADIANLSSARRVKAAAKPAAKGPGLFGNSAAAAAASSNSSAPTTQEINAELLAFIETKIGNEKKKEIETHVVPLINAIRTADPSTYEKLIEQLTEKLIALTKAGLEGTLALALSSRRTAMRPASTYGDDESPVDTNQGDWDEGASSNVAPPTTPSGSSIAKSPVDSKTAAIIAEIRRVYPCPAPSPTPAL